jgi:predicted DNA-binding transcriptional regulator AlpA
MPRDPTRLATRPDTGDPGGERASRETEQSTRQGLDPLTFDTNDLAFVLRTSLATIHRMRAAGKLPRALRWGGQLRWRVDEVRAWVAAGMPDLKSWEAMKADR